MVKRPFTKPLGWGIREAPTPHPPDVRDYYETVKLLLNAGADINAEDKAKQTPLFQAVKRKVEAMTAFLFEHGANAQNKNGASILQYAVRKDSQNLALLLIKHGARLKAHMSLPFFKFLVTSSNSAMLDQYQLEGGDWSWKDSLGQNALFWVHDRGTAERIKNAGLALPSHDRFGNTPLQLSSYSGNVPLVHWFLDHGAKVNDANQDGVTSLAWAAEGGGMWKLSRPLLTMAHPLK